MVPTVPGCRATTIRFGNRWAVAAYAEHLPAIGAWVFAFPVAFRVVEDFWIAAGPGFEGVSRRTLVAEELEELEELELEGDRLDVRKRFFLFRVEAAYDWEIGERYSVGAGIGFDWVDFRTGTTVALIYGVTFGIGF